MLLMERISIQLLLGLFPIWTLLLTCPALLFSQSWARDSVYEDSISLKSQTTIKLLSPQIGNTQHPFQLIQGRIPGMHITHPGGNPFEPFTIRTRGQNAFHYANTQPLILLDEMPIYHVNLIPVWDIHQIQVDVNASSAAKEGLQGMQGIIHFISDTVAGEKLTVKYRNLISQSFSNRQIPVLNADQYLDYGGLDLGSKHQFQDEISRKSTFHQHQLAVSQKWKSTGIILSGQWNDFRPLLKATKRQSLQSRITVSQSLWKERVKFRWNNYQFKSDLEYGEPRAFFYGALFIPTSPVFDVNQNQYGGYYQEVKFNYHNPVSMIDQVHHSGKEINSLNQISGNVKISDYFSGIVMWGEEIGDKERHRWVPENSFFEGSGAGGKVLQETSELSNQWANLFIQHQFYTKGIQITGRSGYEFREVRLLRETIEGQGFTSEINDNTEPSNGNYVINGQSGFAHRIIQLYLRNRISYQDFLAMNLNLAYSGSSRLGINKQWGLFYGVESQINMKRVFNIKSENLFELNFGFAKVGNTPPEDNLNKYVIDPWSKFYYNGDYIEGARYRHQFNPDLSWEQKKEWEIGFTKGFWKNQMILSYRRFYSNIKDIITLDEYNSPYSFEREWLNSYGISNKGWELTLRSQIFNTTKVEWNLDMQLFRFKSKLKEFPQVSRGIGTRCGCGRPYAPQVIEQGQFLGELRVFEEVYNGEYYEIKDKTETITRI